jgi:hypothetical protein
VKNGTLLRLAEADYDVFNTADRNLPHKHTLRTFSLGVVVLTAGSTRLEDLQPLAAELREAIVSARPRAGPSRPGGLTSNRGPSG